MYINFPDNKTFRKANPPCKTYQWCFVVKKLTRNNTREPRLYCRYVAEKEQPAPNVWVFSI